MRKVSRTFLLLCLLAAPLHAQIESFKAARPVWPAGRTLERNLLVGFWALVEAPRAGEPVRLRLTASTFYRASLGGGYLGYGPARGPHGHYRVDEYDITSRLSGGALALAIEVAGYNINSYDTLDAPSFLQAEVLRGDEVVAATGHSRRPLLACVLTHRVQKVQRFSFQRPFIEVYRLGPGTAAWKRAIEEPFEGAELEELEGGRGLLPRRVPYPRYNLRPPLRSVATGRVRCGVAVPRPWKDRSLVNIGSKLRGHAEKELELIPSLELQGIVTESLDPREEYDKVCRHTELDAGSFRILDLGTNLTGFPQACVRCKTATRLYLIFDELLTQGDVDFKRLGCVNAVLWELEPGTYEIESIQPYTMRYMKLLVLEGACTIENPALREYANPAVHEAQFAASDPRLNLLFEAARETLRQNAVDIFMDCPSRERAGWLCDSFFTARAACALAGTTDVEMNFFENYLLPERFEHLPDGMLPMCYPADHDDGVFIPNWAMWFVVQLEEYLQRSGEPAMIAALEPRVRKLLEYFERFRNADGLLEKLESWVFVEWSKANSFVQDVSYPSNMLYAATLEAAGRMYARPELLRQAAAVRGRIREQSYDGEFFVDNAVRREGELIRTRNRSEVCQYFAFYFGVASPATHPELWRRLSEEFGPRRKASGAHPEIHPANAFVGNVLRLELLSRYGRGRQVVAEALEYYLYMAEQTGTLWENVSSHASCNHGFGSHLGHLLYRDALGLRRIDRTGRRITVRFTDHDLEWCEGRLPLADGIIAMRWQRLGDVIEWHLDHPPGWTVELENPEGLRLRRLP